MCYCYIQNSHSGENLTQSWHGGSLPTSPDRQSHTAPVEMTRDEFFRQAQHSGAARSNSLRNSHTGAGAVQNDYVRCGYGSKPVDLPDEPEEDDRYVANIHARFV